MHNAYSTTKFKLLVSSERLKPNFHFDTNTDIGLNKLTTKQKQKFIYPI